MNRFATILLLCCATWASAQDVIVLKNGETIKAKVDAVSTDTVSYHRYDNLQGPNYLLMKSDINCIVYENGTTDMFNSSKETNTGSAQSIGKNCNTTKGNCFFLDTDLRMGVLDGFGLGPSLTLGYQLNPYVSLGTGASVYFDYDGNTWAGVHGSVRSNFSEQVNHGYGELRAGFDFYECCFQMEPTVGYMFKPFNNYNGQAYVGFSIYVNSFAGSGYLFNVGYRFWNKKK